MGIVTFLGKLGTVIATGLAIASGVSPALVSAIGPKASSAIGQISDALSAVMNIVVDAEVWLQGPDKGPEKFARALPMVVAALKASQLLSGHHIANPQLFESGAGKILNGVVDLLNSLKDQIETDGHPMPIPAPTVDAPPVQPPSQPPVAP